MSKKLYSLCLIALLICILSGCGCKHTWAEATCNTPKTCTLCQETEGTILTHIFQEATCTTPKTCTLCGYTEGTSLPHSAGAPVTEADYVRATLSTTTSCIDCGELLSVADESISLTENDLFLFNAEEFVARLNYIYTQTGKTGWSATLEELPIDEGNYYVAIIRYDDIICAQIYLNKEETDPETTTIYEHIDKTQSLDRFLCDLNVQILFYDIAQQVYDWESAASDQQAEWVYSLYIDEAERLLNAVLNPIYKAIDPSLSDAQIEDAVHSAYAETEVFSIINITDIFYQGTCGDVCTEYINAITIMAGYYINFNASQKYWIDINGIA